MDKFQSIIAEKFIGTMKSLDKTTTEKILGDNAAEIGLLLLKEARQRGTVDYDEVCDILFTKFAKEING